MKYFLAIDEGTSSTRAILYDTQGRLCVKSQYSLTQSCPAPGYVEQDAEEIWQKTCFAIRDVVAKINPVDILACGITNQRETTVIWDKRTGECVGPVISWQDQRTESICSAYSAADISDIHQKTGLRMNAYFSATKLHWLLKNMPKAKKLAQKGLLAFGTIDSFLLWRLTKGSQHLTDITNASRTLLFNLVDKTWDETLLDLFEIPSAILPEVQSNDAYFGMMHKEIMGKEIPIHAMIGDQQSALLGQACIRPGMMKATYGSGAFLLMNIGKEPVWSRHQLLTTVAYQVQHQTVFGLEGSIYHAGTILRWLRDGLGILPNVVDSERMAQMVTDNAGVYLVPSFTGLGAPYWLQTPGASYVGLTTTTTANHLVRAALEAIVFQTKDILECMLADYPGKLTSLRVDGGVTQNTWLLHYLASVCQIMVKRTDEMETTAKGAAMLAAIASGHLSSLNDLQTHWHCNLICRPERRQKSYRKAYEGWCRTLEKISR